jgi:DNA (cytosine-5)-methyltransferase 1
LETYKENSEKPIPIDIPAELTVEYWFKKNNVEQHPNANHYFTPRAGLSKFEVIEEGDDLKKSYKRLHRWRYSPTAAYGNNEVHLHPYKSRRISAAEALAIQSLPENFVIPDNITLSDMFKTIGNGVPYLAAKGLAETIFDFIYNNPIKDLRTSYAEINGKQYSSVH